MRSLFFFFCATLFLSGQSIWFYAVGFVPNAGRKSRKLSRRPENKISLGGARWDNTAEDDTPIIIDLRRRSIVKNSVLYLTPILLAGKFMLRNNNNNNKVAIAPTSRKTDDNDMWHPTSLPLLSLDDAYKLSTISEDSFPFGQWPDPILRRPANRLQIPPAIDQQQQATCLTKIQAVAKTLQRTAHEKGAVGLAAQQCGINVSLVYLQTNPKKELDTGLFLLNPRIVWRSPEEEMKVWTEECLVLPPSFRATLLRDAVVTVEYETIFPTSSPEDMPYFSTQQITLEGELARAVQHEMQHDDGILIVDHVGLNELPPFMQEIEAQGHNERMNQAYSRATAQSSLLAHSNLPTTIQPKERSSSWYESIVPRANAVETTPPQNECDDTCLAERKRIIEERRAMMRQSRTNTRRQDVFELSQQRAAMYNTTYRGSNCPPGIPCL